MNTVHEYTEELEKIEKQQAEEDDSSDTPPSDIVAFNELRSCADLVRMYKAEQLIIKPDFQRDIVWNNPAQTRFVDSLVKQLPIPSMCLSLDYKTEKRLMIDGLQRISSIIKFLTQSDWRLSDLDDIDSRITGKTSGFIKEKYSEIYTRIENLTIPVTVLRCDYSKRSHMNYLFTIFHRLNTGGNKLSNQEIRNCIFRSEFNELIKEIVKENNTRELFSLEKNNSYRFAYEELFLRVFTFSEVLSKYSGRLAKFLNEYMDSKKDIQVKELETKKSCMTRTVNLLYSVILDGKPLPTLSKTTTESILIAIYKNIDELEKKTGVELKAMLATLRADEHFSIDSLKEGLSATDKVKSRIKRAIEIFS